MDIQDPGKGRMEKGNTGLTAIMRYSSYQILEKQSAAKGKHYLNGLFGKNLALEESFKILGKTPSTTYRKNLSKFERQGERKNRDNSQLQEKQKVE